MVMVVILKVKTQKGSAKPSRLGMPQPCASSFQTSWLVDRQPDAPFFLFCTHDGIQILSYI